MNKEVKKSQSKTIKKAQRTKRPQPLQVDRSIVPPPWSFKLLKLLGKTNWMLRMIYRAIGQEVLGPRWEIKPRFVVKCTVCEAEYDKKIEVCQSCGGAVRPPSETEYQLIENFLGSDKGRPNPSFTWPEFFRSTLFYDLFCGIYWWSISYAEITTPDTKQTFRVPVATYVEDPEYMRFVADPQGNLGNDEYFCSNCYTPDHYLKGDENKGKPCPQCGYELVQTCYIQQIGMDITARFGLDEIVAGSTDRVLPELYPTPRPVALWMQLLTSKAMDTYNWQVYRKGQVGGIITFPGYDNQQDVDSLEARIKNQIETEEEYDPITGQSILSQKIKNIFLAAKDPPSIIQIMQDLNKLQSLEFYKFNRDALSSVFGVTPVFVSIIESGRSGNNPRMQIDVQNRTRAEIQENYNDSVNNGLLSKFGVKDWVFAFNSSDPRDALRDAQTEQIKAQSALLWITAGFQVRLDDFGELEVSGEPEGISPSPSAAVPGASPPTDAVPKPPEEIGLDLETQARNQSSRAGQQGFKPALWPINLGEIMQRIWNKARRRGNPSEAHLHREQNRLNVIQSIVEAAKAGRISKTEAIIRGTDEISASIRNAMEIARQFAAREAGDPNVILPPEVVRRYAGKRREEIENFKTILEDALANR